MLECTECGEAITEEVYHDPEQLLYLGDDAYPFCSEDHAQLFAERNERT